VTLFQTLTEHAKATPEQPAIIIADGLTLTYRQLHQQVEGVASALAQLGIARTDTVGIALRDGPEMALAFLAVGSVAAAAPLNPSYRRAEFDFEIEDLGLAAMIVGSGDAEITAAAEAADGAGIPVIRVGAQPDAATFAMTVNDAVPPATTSGARTGMDDVALVLHTSGTTSRPKIVPLTNQNVMASAAAIIKTLSLTPAD